ncbi:MAG: M20/M25/M40 family metallo-hydrolase [Bacteroidales bacterium]|nr:M20/M25/M40 family metallo-hydrolase [Bacteroidales bacterium]
MTEELNILKRESIGLLKEMVGIPSPSFEEEGVCTHLYNWLSDKGLQPERIGNNLVCELVSDPQGEMLMLCAHMDTVSPASDYSFNPTSVDYPLAAQIISRIRGEQVGEDEIVAGLGSNDDGASVVSFIAIFRYFSKHPDELNKKNLTLVLSCEEERSGEGGMRSLWGKRLSHIKYAIIGEPTGMRAAISERGLLVLDAEAKGVSGHAARNEGENALYIALDDIQTLRSYSFDKVSPIMGKVHLNVTQINAGTAHNVIPDRCTFVVDIRPTEQYTNEEILAQLSSVCKSTLKARNLANRSSATYEDSPLAEAARLCGIETFSSPTTSDWMRISCDAVKMGPGDSSRSHKKDEYVLCREIEDGIETYIEYIKSIQL